ncbi:MAG: DUF1176 domain-containing protein [Devosia sp.]
MPAFIIFTLLISLSSAAMASEADDRPNYFKQWGSLCQPDGYCLAMTSVEGLAADGTRTRYALTIGRPAQQTFWEVSVQLAGANADSGRDFVASVGGDTLTFSGPDEIAPYGEIDHFYLLGPHVQSLLDKLVHGAALDIGFTDRTGAAGSVTFPLSGLGAALIWIDTQQHRIGSERVAETPPYGLVRADLPGGMWMAPAIAALQ